MTARDDDLDADGDRPPTSTTAGDESQEPDWATEIGRLRRAQGRRLRQVFSTFDDEQEER